MGYACWRELVRCPYTLKQKLIENPTPLYNYCMHFYYKTILMVGSDFLDQIFSAFVNTTKEEMLNGICKR